MQIVINLHPYRILDFLLPLFTFIGRNLSFRGSAKKVDLPGLIFHTFTDVAQFVYQEYGDSCCHWGNLGEEYM